MKTLIIFSVALITFKWIHINCDEVSGVSLDAVRYTVPVEEPEFVDHVPNVTVAIGRDAKIPCVVNNLETYRVAWLKVEDKTILTIHHHVITRNNRISLSHSDLRVWTLHIKNVQESDRGGYMCQINTMPMKSQVGYLDVTVPPDFVNTETSTDVMVRENLNVTLKCKAKGYPNPRLTWRREDNQPLEYGNWQQNKNQGIDSETTLEGEELTINKVSRLHMAAYLCIAQNGVPPSVSRRIVLQVHFPPMIWIPNQLIGASIGSEVTLDCNTEAFPLSLNYWTKDDNYMIVSSDKFKTSNSEKSYKVHMKLTIKNIESSDFGTYRCFAKNSLGSTQGSIRLYESKEPSTARIQSLNVIRTGIYRFGRACLLSDQIKQKKNIKTSDIIEDEDYSNSSNSAIPQTLIGRKLLIFSYFLIFWVISTEFG